MPTVLDNINLYQQIQHRNETLFIPAVERIRNNLSDTEYQQLLSVPKKIEAYIDFLYCIDEALDNNNLFNIEIQRFISIIETPSSYENFHLFSEEEELYKRNRPLNKYFTQPEVIHFTVLFGCGEKIARNYAYIKELLYNPEFSPDHAFIIDTIKTNMQL